MLGNLPAFSADGILKIKEQLQSDPRPHKIDLGVGVYKDASGATPYARGQAGRADAMGGRDDQELHLAAR